MLQSFVFDNVGHYVLHVTASNEFGSATNSIALVNMSFYLFLCSLSVSVFLLIAWSYSYWLSLSLYLQWYNKLLTPWVHSASVIEWVAVYGLLWPVVGDCGISALIASFHGNGLHNWFIRPPGTVVPGGLMFYCRCFFLIHREISELRRPIAAKLCHVIGS